MLHWAFDPSNAVAVQGWGFILAVVGLLLTIAGFGVTWRQLWLAKTAAKAVADEIQRVQLSVQTYDAANQVAKALASLDSARRHLENDAWADVADSYEEFRRSINSFRRNSESPTNEFSKQIDTASAYIVRLCQRIETGLTRGNMKIDKARTKSMIREHGELAGQIENAVQRSIVA